MVQSTGAANAQYLRSLVLEGEGEKRFGLEENVQMDESKRLLCFDDITFVFE